MRTCARESLIDAGDGVRLQGFWSRHNGHPARGLVILLHGWEGSVDSAYMLSSGRFLFARGFDIFRLNLRDHGDTHHLNSGLFLGTLIDEVFAAVAHAAARGGGLPVFLAGFSIGGSFAARVARRCLDAPVPTLERVVCINPPLDPMKSTRRIDELGLIKRYFLKKWKRSLKIKQALFPSRYDFGDILRMKSCMEMTEALIRRYTEYEDAADYFSRYTLTRGWLDRMPLPVTLITAEDDPVVPVEDFYAAEPHRNVTLVIHPYGGHCGFITGPRLDSWISEHLASVFEGASRNT
jgi:predicted alpha/beta-fold hydrolase